MKCGISVYPSNQHDPYAIGAGAIPNKSMFHVFGEATNVDNTMVTVWPLNTLYTFPTVQSAMEIVSSNAADDADIAGTPGTGVQTVEIHYLDNTFTEKTYTFTMNGTTAVTSSVSDIYRINNMYATAVGSAGAAVGNITLRTAGPGTTYGYIAAGHVTAHQAVYTIPAGKKMLVTWWDVSSGAATGTHYTRFYWNASVDMDGNITSGRFLMEHDVLGSLNNAGHVQGIPPHYVPPTADLMIKVISDNALADVVASSHFHGWLEPV